MLTKVAITAIALSLASLTMSSLPAQSGNRQAAYQTYNGPIVVSMMSSPQMLRGRFVEDIYGRPLGRVVSVSVDREGKAEVVNIEVGGLLNLGTRVMPFAADRIVYYPTHAKLVASNDAAPFRAPAVDPNSPTKASVKRQAPSETIIRY